MPAAFSIPQHEPERSLHEGPNRHFISSRDFELWRKQHDSVRPETVKLDPALTPARPEAQRYQAPQHPASHVLHSIPARAPARSSRSNILSYTLYLSTVSRLSTYSTPVGSGALLHRAESHDPLGGAGDDDWMEQEEKSIGLRKTSIALLAASRKEGPLPLMVDRRVALAGLTDDILTSPLPELASTPITIQSSAHVESLIALSPLTSPDQTTLYDPAVAAAHATSSIAQSLINMKFGGSVDGEKLASYSQNRQSESVFGMDEGSGSSRKLTQPPHMDYRIVRGQAMKSRAKEIFATSILPTETVAWCRRHRVDGCAVCSTKIQNKKLDGKTFRRNFPGQGLSGPLSKKPLVEVVPAFLVFSATLLKDLQERATLSDESDLGSPYVSIPNVPNSTVDATAAWYSLLHSLTIQACLEGYLVDGWTGTEAIEILFGCGCGVWEGKGWASRVARSNQAASQSAREKEKARAMDTESESDSESEEDEVLEKEQARQDGKRSLLEAAQCLFGSRDEAQAEFERSMRDRTHEFLDVGDDSLATHLRTLTEKYPLSTFEREMVDFLECASKQLGKPSLARYESAATTPAGQIPSADPDPYALTRYFERSESPVNEPISSGPHRAWEDGDRLKRRRLE